LRKSVSAVLFYLLNKKIKENKTKQTKTKQNKTKKQKKGIRIASTQAYWEALGAESRVCYPGNTADSQAQWALTYCYHSQSAAS
jgi:hypothetical protein